jgi:hypothetical protein
MLFVQPTDPLVSTALGLAVTVVSMLVVPFVFGGLLGMADEALGSSTGFGTFIDAGKRHYTSMLGAYLLLVVGSVLLSIVAGIATAVLGVGTLSILGGASGAGLSNTALIATATVSMAVFFLLLMIPLLFVQFYGQAIVIDNRGVAGGFKRSVGLVRRNLLSVCGYSALVFGTSLVFGLLLSVPSMLLSARTAQPAISALPDFSLPVIIGFVLLGTFLSSLLGSLFLTFSVAFYRALDSTRDVREPSAALGVRS